MLSMTGTGICVPSLKVSGTRTTASLRLSWSFGPGRGFSGFRRLAMEFPSCLQAGFAIPASLLHSSYHGAEWKVAHLEWVLDSKPELRRRVGIDRLGRVEAEDGPLHEREPGDVDAQAGAESFGDVADNLSAQV